MNSELQDKLLTRFNMNQLEKIADHRSDIKRLIKRNEKKQAKEQVI